MDDLYPQIKDLRNAAVAYGMGNDPVDLFVT